MNSQKKVFITGTGRCGTTFLILILTYLKLDTGYSIENFDQFIEKNCNSGMERSHLDSPSFIKGMRIFTDIDTVIKDVKIEHIIIPIRDYNISAKSREFYGKNCGGLMENATDYKSQLDLYYKYMSNFILTITKHDIPTTFICFDKMINSPTYLYKKIEFILNNITFEEFKQAYEYASLHQRKSSIISNS